MKKGFTISEILITLTAIGLISAITIPVLYKNISAIQTRTILRKGFSILTNAYVIQFGTKTPPTNNNDVDKMMDMINSNMEVKYYLNCDDTKCEVKYNKSEQNINSWIVTEEYIAYKIIQGGGNCIDKSTLNEITNSKDATDATCFAIKIDAGCIAKKGKESECIEIEDGTNELVEKIKKNEFTGTQIRAFVSSTSITSGNSDNTSAGIIVANE